jgi:MFS transporter, putative metabolite:H+ symporter
MIPQNNQSSVYSAKKQGIAATIIARQDRLPVWSLPKLFIGILGLGFLFTFFDIFDINVSFIQTCTQIVAGCTTETASRYIGSPVLMSLVGYVIGTLILSPLADRYGRRDMMVITLGLTSLGSFYTAIVGDYTNFVIARTITGIGIGADLALVTIYMNEMAPNKGRARFTSLIFIMSSLGAFLATWLGLYLTTPSTPFPLGLPIAIAGPQFTIGWRVIYAFGTLLAIICLIMRFRIPESTRWLIIQGRISQAERVVTAMEKQALKRVQELPPALPRLAMRTHMPSIGYSEIFSKSVYLKRTILLLSIWFIGYITVYAIAAGFTAILVTLKYAPSEAGLIAAIGSTGFILSSIFGYYFGEGMERKRWILVSGLITLIGGIVIALGPSSFMISTLGSIIVFFGFNLWVPMTFTWSAENYPTRARASGFALVDGIGHVGGGIGLIFIASLITKLGALLLFVLIGSFLLAAACLAQFGPTTYKKRLDEVSP